MIKVISIPLDHAHIKMAYIFDISVAVGNRPDHIVHKHLETVSSLFKTSDVAAALDKAGIPYSVWISPQREGTLHQMESPEAMIASIVDKLSEELNLKTTYGYDVMPDGEPVEADMHDYDEDFIEDLDEYRTVTSVINNEIDDNMGLVLEDAFEAIRGEIEYQDNLARRTHDEAGDVPGFLTLCRRYLRKAEDAWADNPSSEKSLQQLRKIAAISVRAMVYCGVRHRD